ncbi:MAG: class II fructose-bisphosphate aldolase [Patescibacteria group bacterium]|jgi:fructose-bisphosphate aldolase class II
MLVHIQKILKKSQKGGYAIGAFNTSNLEVTLGICRAAVKNQSPIIMQVSEATIEYAGIDTIVAIINSIAKGEAKDIPMALHLDHGHSLEVIKECVKAGFSSVHMDASTYPYEENIAMTRKASDFAHQFGVWTQGELGSMFGKEGMSKVKLPDDPDSFMTDPNKVKDFISRSKIDTLAVSIGTMHGSFEGKELIDFARLAKIRKNTNKPLVLHGASGTKDFEIRKAVKMGINIINIDTDIRIAFTKALQQTLGKKISFYDPRKILAPSIEGVSKAVGHKMIVFNSISKI